MRVVCQIVFGTLNVKCSYVESIAELYRFFCTLFYKKHLPFPLFLSDCIEEFLFSLRTYWKCVVWIFIQLHNPDLNLWLNKNCAIFLAHPIHVHYLGSRMIFTHISAVLWFSKGYHHPVFRLHIKLK